MDRPEEFETPNPNNDDEDREALAAIDDGIHDAEAGRNTPLEEVRKRLAKWITASSSHKEP
jgi:predicted transcriptional regulator